VFLPLSLRVSSTSLCLKGLNTELQNIEMHHTLRLLRRLLNAYCTLQMKFAAVFSQDNIHVDKMLTSFSCFLMPFFRRRIFSFYLWIF
jgi:hypothetical protein